MQFPLRHKLMFIEMPLKNICWSLPGDVSVGSCGKRSLGLLTTLLRSQLMGRRELQRQKEECGVGGEHCLRYYPCASSAKNAVPVAQAPCQHRMTEGTVHRITVVQEEQRSRREK